jgi:RNA polymerase sigma-70 factor (ECF subfamily)
MSLIKTDGRAEAEDNDESELVRRLAAMDEEAWRAAYQCYFPSVFRLAYVRVLNQAAAEDIAAKVYLEAIASIGRYQYRGVPFRAWLFRIASNEVSDYIKQQRRKPQVSIEDAGELALEDSGDIEIRADLLEALDLLTELQKNVVVLRFIAGCTLSEVAQVLGRSIGAIKQLQSRAIGVLQEALLPDGQG